MLPKVINWPYCEKCNINQGKADLSKCTKFSKCLTPSKGFRLPFFSVHIYKIAVVLINTSKLIHSHKHMTTVKTSHFVPLNTGEIKTANLRHLAWFLPWWLERKHIWVRIVLMIHFYVGVMVMARLHLFRQDYSASLSHMQLLINR